LWHPVHRRFMVVVWYHVFHAFELLVCIHRGDDLVDDLVNDLVGDLVDDLVGDLVDDLVGDLVEWC
jgi:hypothetical protein